METNSLIEYGTAKKNWWEFTEEDVLEANEKYTKEFVTGHGRLACLCTT